MQSPYSLEIEKQMQERGVAIFAKAFLGVHAQKSGKNHATANACGCPSRPASLVAYPTGGMQHSYAMTRRDVGKPAFSLRKQRFVKTHALSLLGTTRLLSRSGRGFNLPGFIRWNAHIPETRESRSTCDNRIGMKGFIHAGRV